MTRALLDATVVIAAADSDDDDHEVGYEILQGVDGGVLPTGIVVSDALQESLNYIHERQRHELATDLLDRFVRGAQFEIPYNPKKNYGTARSMFRDSERLNFGDAMQVAYMQSEGIEYIYSFDDDFDGFQGVIRLDTAVNPYN